MLTDKTIKNQIKLKKKLFQEFVKKAGQLYIKFHYPYVLWVKSIRNTKLHPYEKYLENRYCGGINGGYLRFQAYMEDRTKFKPGKCKWVGFYPKNTPSKYHRPIRSKREIAYMAECNYYNHHQVKKPPQPAWFKIMKTTALLKYKEQVEKEMEREKAKRQAKVKVDCCICLTTKKGNQMIKSKSCSHSVCYKCYGDAFQGGNPIYKCPLCRANFGQISY